MIWYDFDVKGTDLLYRRPVLSRPLHCKLPAVYDDLFARGTCKILTLVVRSLLLKSIWNLFAPLLWRYESMAFLYWDVTFDIF